MDFTGARWRKSSYSNGNSGAGCVEVAHLAGGQVALRDTKDRTRRPHVYPGPEWHAFLTAIRAGELNQP